MLCEECNKNQATVVVTVLSGNGTTVRHLCQECVEKMETSIAKGELSSFLTSLLNILEPQKAETLRCDVCGLTYDEFQNTGKLGCAECYKVFAGQLKPLLLRVHGRSQHAGRVPADREQERAFELSITKLKERMNQAVGVENFEEAAAIRDEIKNLTEKQKAEAKAQ
jgi:protein arginine kinase activator